MVSAAPGGLCVGGGGMRLEPAPIPGGGTGMEEVLEGGGGMPPRPGG